MFQLSWTRNRGENNLEDFFTIHETQAEAEKHLEKVWADCHCWSICKILKASEPHWVEP